ncbi:MAG: hypothetical protein IJO61_06690 [Oscillospiraceae bacterium]|nr:hypothetical protein [Oscillospiraceae bacterium]MBQ7120148.1 hypothetical protein [Oscillospiraceae bacterium]
MFETVFKVMKRIFTYTLQALFLSCLVTSLFLLSSFLSFLFGDFFNFLYLSPLLVLALISWLTDKFSIRVAFIAHTIVMSICAYIFSYHFDFSTIFTGSLLLYSGFAVVSSFFVLLRFIEDRHIIHELLQTQFPIEFKIKNYRFSVTKESIENEDLTKNVETNE